MTIAAVDLFCGIGGLTHGLIQAGIPVTAGYDLDESCSFAYEANNTSTFHSADITELRGEEINSAYPEDCMKILVGCAPCQPFSKHTQKNKHRDQDDDWRLLDSFSRLILEVEPTIVSMENVIELSGTKVFQDFVDSLEEQQYYVSWTKVYCPDYGIPQSRTRLVLLASRMSAINIIPPTHTPDEYLTVEETIGHLNPINAGESSLDDPIHRSASLGEMNLNRIRASRPGGTWRDWEEELISPCHTRETGRSYSSVYARMTYEDVSPTITTQFYNFGTGRFGHPEQDRAISIREGALLQTFPENYQFIESVEDFSIKRLGTHIGNAVPVRLGLIIGMSIIRHLQNHRVEL